MSMDRNIGPAPVQRDEHGYWMHPGIQWNDLPDETNPTEWFASMGFECAFIDLEDDGSQEVQDRYFRDGSPDVSEWTPSRPGGDGWFLAAIYDTDDGPCAVFIRAAHQATKEPSK